MIRAKRGLEHLPCGSRLRDLRLFNLGKVVCRSHSTFQDLQGSWRGTME